MAKSSNVIRIPKVPAESFNKERPVSDLLWTQVEYLAAVVKKDIDDERRAVRTEGQASDFIRKYTALIHPQGDKKKPPPSRPRAGKKRTPSAKK